jgi:hypothetical protein
MKGRHIVSAIGLLAMFLGLINPLAPALAPQPVLADHTPDPSSVTIAGSLQSELGCAGDWDPACAATYLTYDADDTVWQGTFNVPAGSYEYKAVLNDSWDENYGANATPNGANIPLNLGAETAVKFYYDHARIGSRIMSTRSSLPCRAASSPNWVARGLGSRLPALLAARPGRRRHLRFLDQRRCQRGITKPKWPSTSPGTRTTGGGVLNGANIPSPFQEGATVTFTYDPSDHVLTISTEIAPPELPTVNIPGSFQDELGCADDWDPACEATYLGYDVDDTVWQGTFSVPEGNWEYKAALERLLG